MINRGAPTHRAGSAMCEGCGKDVDLSWNFCPLCGQDNRAPERRQDPVPSHVHQFNFGGFCTQCGAQASDPSQAPPGALTFQAGVFGSIVNGLVPVAIGVLFLWRSLDLFTSTTRYASDRWFVLIPILFIVIGLLPMLWIRRTVIDPTNRLVGWQQGLRLIAQPHSEPFSNFVGIGLRSVWHSNTGSDMSSYDAYSVELQRADGSGLLLRNNGFWNDSVHLGQSLSGMMGIPFDDTIRSGFLRFS